MRRTVGSVLIGISLCVIVAAAPTAFGYAAAVDPTIVAAGDIADPQPRPGTIATANLIGTLNPTAVITLGDNAYPSGTATDFAKGYAPTWGRYLAKTYPALGNHDWKTNGAGGYFGYFGSRAPGAYYSYNLGSWHIVVLDSNCNTTPCNTKSAQYKWLQQDLASNNAVCTLAVWHAPRFSSGPHGNRTNVGFFWNLLYADGADVILNGHDHVYERFAPQNPNGQATSNGIVQFTVGIGGHSLETFRSTQPNSLVRYNQAAAVLQLTLHPTSYDFALKATNGQTPDQGSANCH